MLAQKITAGFVVVNPAVIFVLLQITADFVRINQAVILGFLRITALYRGFLCGGNSCNRLKIKGFMAMSWKFKKKKSLNQVIGREKEKALLKEIVESKRAEFVAVYGRRRVGKTYLVKHFFDSMGSLFFHVTGLQGGSLKEQLNEFSRQLGSTFFEGTLGRGNQNWMEAFEELHRGIQMAPKDQKILLFLDEFPWMATPRSKLLTALELYWNRHWSFDERIKLVICGSSTSFITEKIINNKGGLHNRVTRNLHLKPFSLKETEAFLKEQKIHLKQKQILDLYTVLGGVPLYWTFVRKGRSAHQVIEELCFQGDGPLVKEFDRLFSSLFEDPKPYMDLIRIIAKYRYGIEKKRLLEESKISDGGTITTRLVHLEEAGFVTSLVPYGKERGLYYVMEDEYSLFYLTWIAPYLKTIAKKGVAEGFWLAQATQPKWKIWAGIAFESVCYKHLEAIRKALKIEAGARAGTWRFVSSQEDGAQIDLLFDRTDHAITLCEIKGSQELYAIDKAYARSILRKIEVFQKQTKTQKQIFFSMITTNGIRPTMYSEELISSQVVLEDLFLV